MVMRAGRLDKVVDIKQKTVTRNETGEEVVVWSAIDGGESIWAGIEPVSGKEYFEAEQVHAQMTVQIIIRYLLGVESAMRVYHGDDVYEIVAPPIDKSLRRESLTLMCHRIDPGVS